MVSYRLCRHHPTIGLITVLVLKLILFNAGFAQQTDTNFFITAGRDASVSEGDSLFRAVFYIGCPPTVAGSLHLRIFDADIGGKFDQIITPSRARYRLYGKGTIQPHIRSISDPTRNDKPLIDLELGEDELYDNQWRTLGSFRVIDGEPIDSLSTFQFIVDGASGSSINLYQIFVSSEEKRNTAMTGIHLTTPVMTVLIPASDKLAIQIPFIISPKATVLDMHNFDAEDMGELFLQTCSREKVPVCLSGNSFSCSTRIPIQESERGNRAALIVMGEHVKADYIQCWISNESGEFLPLLVPPMISPMNHLPVPGFDALPLSDCLSALLDASATTDPDGDDMSFQWFSGEQSIGEGRRIVHRFPQAGQFPVRLVVEDNSGFVANTKQLTKPIRINSVPSAEFDAPQTAAPLEDLVFDGTRSRDEDGQILQYLWDFGDGEKAAGKIVRHAYTRAGRYGVTLRVEDDSQSFCNNSEKTSVVWVNSPPVSNAHLKSEAAVDEDVKMDGLGSIDSDGEIIRYVWKFGDGSAAEGATVSHHYQAPGTYRVQLIVSDNAGAKNSTQMDSATVVVNAPPVAVGKGKSIVSIREVVVFDAAGSYDPDGRITEYEWDLGDGTVKTGKQVLHAYGKPSRFEIRLTVKDNSNVMNNETEMRFSIRVNSPPVPNAGGDRLVNSSTVFFDAGASRDEDDAIIDYEWDFGDSQSAHGRTARHTFALPGTYRVRLVVKDGSGTSTAVQSDTIQVKVNHPPMADAGRKRVVAPGETVVLDAGFSHDPDGEIVSYRWEAEKGIVKIGKRVEYTYQNPGLFQALLAVQDNADAEDVHSVDIVVNAQPIARITPINRKAPGQEVVFDGSGSFDPEGGIIEAKWDFGDGSPQKNGLTVTHVYSSPGRYLASLTVRDNSQASNCTGISTQPISINHTPVPDAGKDQYTCSQTIHFNGSSSFDADNDPLVLVWNFGDSVTASGTLVTHTYRRPGVYPVRLTVDDGTGLSNAKTEMFIKVHINSSPSAVIDAPTEVCAGENILLDASRSSDPDKDPLKYVWDFGDGTVGEGVNPVHVYKQGGLFRVLLTVMDNSELPCNVALAEVVVYAVDAPVAKAGEDRTMCANMSVLFDGSHSSGGNRSIQGYEWDFGDGHQGGGIRTFHTYTQAGLYTVKLKISVPPEGNCENYSEDELTIKVLPSPIVAFDFSQSGCAGKEMVFDAGASTAGNATITQYTWDFGDDVTEQGVRSAHCYQKSGKYNVRLTLMTDAEQECNTAYLEHSVFINDPPCARMEITTSQENLSAIVPFSVVSFSARESDDRDGSIRRYNWSFGDGGSADGVFVQHWFTRPGQYHVHLSVEDNSRTSCKTDTVMTTISIVTPPVWTIDGPPQACIDEPIVFSLQSSGEEKSITDTILWHLDGRDTLGGCRLTKAFAVPGDYQVQAFCRNTWSTAKDIRIYSIPVVLLPEQMEVDAGEPLVIQPLLTNEGKLPLAFQWDLGDGTRTDQLPLHYVYNAPGLYTAKLTLRYTRLQSCPVSEYTVRVSVLASPDMSIEVCPDTLYSGGARDEATFKAVCADSSRAFACRWDFGDGQTDSGPCVKHAYQRPGSFLVQLTVWDASRKSAKRVTVQKRIQVLSR
jgi:PKD repeat protein